MNRRELVKALGALSVSSSPFASANETSSNHRIGVLAQDLQPGLLEAFRDQLQKLGYPEAFEKAASAKSEALFVMDDGAITQHRKEILDLAVKYGLPVVSIYRDFAEAGGLIAYGPNLNVVYRRAADYVVKLMNGEQPSDLPVEQPVSFDLEINLKTARALGITVPQSVLIRADKVIE